jgi:hypothetical protein
VSFADDSHHIDQTVDRLLMELPSATSVYAQSYATSHSSSRRDEGGGATVMSTDETVHPQESSSMLFGEILQLDAIQACVEQECSLAEQLRIPQHLMDTLIYSRNDEEQQQQQQQQEEDTDSVKGGGASIKSILNDRLVLQQQQQQRTSRTGDERIMAARSRSSSPNRSQQQQRSHLPPLHHAKEEENSILEQQRDRIMGLNRHYHPADANYSPAEEDTMISKQASQTSQSSVLVGERFLDNSTQQTPLSSLQAKTVHKEKANKTTTPIEQVLSSLQRQQQQHRDPPGGSPTLQTAPARNSPSRQRAVTPLQQRRSMGRSSPTNIREHSHDVSSPTTRAPQFVSSDISSVGLKSLRDHLQPAAAIPSPPLSPTLSNWEPKPGESFEIKTSPKNSKSKVTPKSETNATVKHVLSLSPVSAGSKLYNRIARVRSLSPLHKKRQQQQQQQQEAQQAAQQTASDLPIIKTNIQTIEGGKRRPASPTRAQLYPVHASSVMTPSHMVEEDQQRIRRNNNNNNNEGKGSAVSTTDNTSAHTSAALSSIHLLTDADSIPAIEVTERKAKALPKAHGSGGGAGTYAYQGGDTSRSRSPIRQQQQGRLSPAEQKGRTNLRVDTSSPTSSSPDVSVIDLSRVDSNGSSMSPSRIMKAIRTGQPLLRERSSPSPGRGGRGGGGNTQDELLERRRSVSPPRTGERRRSTSPRRKNQDMDEWLDSILEYGGPSAARDKKVEVADPGGLNAWLDSVIKK